MSDATRRPNGFATMLQDLAPDRCRIDWMPLDASTVEGLTANELAYVSAAVASRRTEFATGRALLRRLLGRDVEILRRTSGAPALPVDMSGSLAHDRGVVVAVVGPAEHLAAIGIDVEPDEPIEQPVADLIVRPDDLVPDTVTAFVAKEAAYKAWSWLGGAMLEHHDVRLTVEGLRFTADLRGEMTLSGRIGRSDGRVVALAVRSAS